MPPKTYEELKQDQTCIYQAFQNVDGNKDTPSQMGAYVNGKGIDADADAAVQVLAAKYGLDSVEMFMGKSWNAGDYNLDQGWEYVLTVNGQASMLNDFKALNSIVVKGKPVVDLQVKYGNAVGHAVYCKVKKTDNTVQTWADAQGIYKKPPQFPDQTVVVAYGRKRVD